MRLPKLHRPRLSYANVTSTAALVLATSMGGAYAHGLIGPEDIKLNAVKSKHIDGGNVKTSDLGASAVTTGKVKNRTLTGSDFALRAHGVALAGVTISGSGITHQFNRLGGAITVSNPSAGTYDLTIPGASFDGYASAVYALTAGFTTYCYLNNAGSTDPTSAQIRCRTHAGTLTNTDVSFVVFKDAVGVPAPRTMPRKAAGSSADGS